MTTIGLMIEGQEDLTWERFFRLAQAAEDLGFECLFRSDHLTALENFPARQSLELWTSLTTLATRTRRLRFGPLVCSLTFCHPALIAKKAAALHELSAGRFELGIGAGWYKGEHRMFGLPYPPYAARLEMLEEGARVIKALWAGAPASFTGRHYTLDQAETHAGPRQAPPPLIMGGKNEQRTLRIIAEHASEWNCTYISAEGFRRKSAVLDEHCAALGRDPRSLRRSLMLPFVIGRGAAEVQTRIDAQRAMFPSLPADLAGWRAAGYIGGGPAEVVEQLHAYAAAGAARVVVQHNSLDDLASLDLLARDVLPQFA
ncbi:MAG: TIGR03560 family F420-dependent LLM class oxidoreductase [Anaerolineales bacterium]|nr:TIGR03560 family F420-dependent LLM class oxidoreductase [Anaerolineales bacterium]